MFGQLFAGSRLVQLPLFALVLFVAVFAVVIVRTTVLARRGGFARLERLPLDDGQPVPAQRTARGGEVAS